MMDLKKMIRAELDRNSGKLSPDFIDEVSQSATVVVHRRLTHNTRVCVIVLPSGHELVGYAQVLDAKNDDESIGRKVAYDNAKEQLWSTLGSIAKVVG